MKLVPIYIFMFFIQLSFSQTDSLRYYHKNNFFLKGIKLGENRINDIEKLININIKEYFEVQNILFYFYEKTSKIDSAIELSEKAIRFLKLKKLDNTAEFYYIMVNLSNIYHRIKADDKSKQILDKIINSKELKIKRDDLWYASVLYQRGSISINELEFDMAENFLINSQGIYKNVVGDNSNEYLVCSSALIEVLLEKMKLSEAYVLATEIVKKYNLKYGDSNEEYLKNLYSLSIIEYLQGKYSLAEVNSLKVFDLTKSLRNGLYGVNLHSLAKIYIAKNELLKAEYFLSKSVEIEGNTSGENTNEFIAVLSELAHLYEKKEDYLKSEQLYLQSYEISKKINNQKTKAVVVSNLAKIYYRNNNFNKAYVYYLESARIFKEIYGETHINYINVMQSIAVVLDKLDRIDEAESILINSHSIIKEKKTENSVAYIYSNSLLSRFYSTNNRNLPKADFYNQIGLDLVKDKFGDKSQEYEVFLMDKANIKSELGDFKVALQLYEECLELSKNIYGMNSLRYAVAVNNLAQSYYENSDFIKSEKYYNIDMEIVKNKFGENHLEFASCLNNLSNIYFLSDKQKGIQYNLKSLQIIENNIGKDNIKYAQVSSCLGGQYFFVNDFVNSEKYHLISYYIKLRKFNKFNVSRIVNLSNIVGLYNRFENTNKGRVFLSEYLEIIKSNFLESSFNFSENELLIYLKYRLKENPSYNFLNRSPTQYPEINIGCYENELLIKNLSLRNQQRISKSIQQSNNIELKERYEQFVSNKRTLTKWNELPLDKKPENFETLTTETESLEKELVRSSSAFAEAKTALSIGWKQIQEKLKTNELAIDLVSFNYYNKKWTDSIVYSAFVVGKNYKAPKYIPLFEEKQLSFLLEKNKHNQDSTRINDQYIQKEISDLFLKPLQEVFKGVKTIYLSPSGLGNQINFSALPTVQNTTFGNQYKVHLLGTTAELVNQKTTFLDNNNQLELLLYGNIDYNKAEVDNIKKQELPQTNDDFVALTRASTTTEKHGFLKGSKQEIENIKALATQHNFASKIIQDRLATEESIKALDGKTTPFVLHLATHGFFFPNPKKDLPEINAPDQKTHYKTSNDPMMRSGLLFAGADRYWGKPIENLTTEDGIMTANEISNLDLSACQLVVMSACETGLGQINGSEGVFGLQRAFKMAGVKNIIMSLWKVPDTQTAELFDVFYTECFKGLSIHEAFKNAQTKMKTKYTPYYWAGFVLLE